MYYAAALTAAREDKSESFCQSATLSSKCPCHKGGIVYGGTSSVKCALCKRITGNMVKTVLSRIGWSANVGQSVCTTNCSVRPAVAILFLLLKSLRVKTTEKMTKVQRRNQRRKTKSLHLALPLDRFLMKTQIV